MTFGKRLLPKAKSQIVDGNLLLQICLMQYMSNIDFELFALRACGVRCMMWSGSASACTARRSTSGSPTMITAIVRYRLPPSIDHDACLAHFEKISPGFRAADGLISKHFIWSERGIAGGVYQWQSLDKAKSFYSGPWRQGIIERYGMEPEIEYFEVFCITDNAKGRVEVLGRPKSNARRSGAR
jgi:hypothetical protein